MASAVSRSCGERRALPWNCLCPLCWVFNSLVANRCPCSYRLWHSFKHWVWVLCCSYYISGSLVSYLPLWTLSRVDIVEYGSIYFSFFTIDSFLMCRKSLLEMDCYMSLHQCPFLMSTLTTFFIWEKALAFQGMFLF